MRRRKRIEPTDDWDQLVPLFESPEQKEYEEIRPLMLFGSSVAERVRVTGTPERTMYRKVERFENEGPKGLFSDEGAKRQLLPRAIRRMIVDLKAEHPALNNNEIRNIVYVRTGRRLGDHTYGLSSGGSARTPVAVALIIDLCLRRSWPPNSIPPHLSLELSSAPASSSGSTRVCTAD